MMRLLFLIDLFLQYETILLIFVGKSFTFYCVVDCAETFGSTNFIRWGIKFPQGHWFDIRQ